MFILFPEVLIDEKQIFCFSPDEVAISLLLLFFFGTTNLLVEFCQYLHFFFSNAKPLSVDRPSLSDRGLTAERTRMKGLITFRALSGYV